MKFLSVTKLIKFVALGNLSIMPKMTIMLTTFLSLFLLFSLNNEFTMTSALTHQIQMFGGGGGGIRKNRTNNNLPSNFSVPNPSQLYRSPGSQSQSSAAQSVISNGYRSSLGTCSPDRFNSPGLPGSSTSSTTMSSRSPQPPSDPSSDRICSTLSGRSLGQGPGNSFQGPGLQQPQPAAVSVLTLVQSSSGSNSSSSSMSNVGVTMLTNLLPSAYTVMPPPPAAATASATAWYSGSNTAVVSSMVPDMSDSSPRSVGSHGHGQSVQVATARNRNFVGICSSTTSTRPEPTVSSRPEISVSGPTAAASSATSGTSISTLNSISQFPLERDMYLVKSYSNYRRDESGFYKKSELPKRWNPNELLFSSVGDRPGSLNLSVIASNSMANCGNCTKEITRSDECAWHYLINEHLAPHFGGCVATAADYVAQVEKIIVLNDITDDVSPKAVSLGPSSSQCMSGPMATRRAQAPQALTIDVTNDDDFQPASLGVSTDTVGFEGGYGDILSITRPAVSSGPSSPCFQNQSLDNVMNLIPLAGPTSPNSDNHTTTIGAHVDYDNLNLVSVLTSPTPLHPQAPELNLSPPPLLEIGSYPADHLNYLSPTPTPVAPPPGSSSFGPIAENDTTTIPNDIMIDNYGNQSHFNFVNDNHSTTNLTDAYFKVTVNGNTTNVLYYKQSDLTNFKQIYYSNKLLNLNAGFRTRRSNLNFKSWKQQVDEITVGSNKNSYNFRECMDVASSFLNQMVEHFKTLSDAGLTDGLKPLLIDEPDSEKPVVEESLSLRCHALTPTTSSESKNIHEKSIFGMAPDWQNSILPTMKGLAEYSQDIFHQINNNLPEPMQNLKHSLQEKISSAVAQQEKQKLSMSMSSTGKSDYGTASTTSSSTIVQPASQPLPEPTPTVNLDHGTDHISPTTQCQLPSPTLSCQASPQSQCRGSLKSDASQSSGVSMKTHGLMTPSVDNTPPSSYRQTSGSSSTSMLNISPCHYTNIRSSVVRRRSSSSKESTSVTVSRNHSYNNKYEVEGGPGPGCPATSSDHSQVRVMTLQCQSKNLRKGFPSLNRTMSDSDVSRLSSTGSAASSFNKHHHSSPNSSSFPLPSPTTGPSGKISTPGTQEKQMYLVELYNAKTTPKTVTYGGFVKKDEVAGLVEELVTVKTTPGDSIKCVGSTSGSGIFSPRQDLLWQQAIRKLEENPRNHVNRKPLKKSEESSLSNNSKVWDELAKDKIAKNHFKGDEKAAESYLNGVEKITLIEAGSISLDLSANTARSNLTNSGGGGTSVVSGVHGPSSRSRHSAQQGSKKDGPAGRSFLQIQLLSSSTSDDGTQQSQQLLPSIPQIKSYGLFMELNEAGPAGLRTTWLAMREYAQSLLMQQSTSNLILSTIVAAYKLWEIFMNLSDSPGESTADSEFEEKMKYLAVKEKEAVEKKIDEFVKNNGGLDWFLKVLHEEESDGILAPIFGFTTLSEEFLNEMLEDYDFRIRVTDLFSGKSNAPKVTVLKLYKNHSTDNVLHPSEASSPFWSNEWELEWIPEISDEESEDLVQNDDESDADECHGHSHYDQCGNSRRPNCSESTDEKFKNNADKESVTLTDKSKLILPSEEIEAKQAPEPSIPEELPASLLLLNDLKAKFKRLDSGETLTTTTTGGSQIETQTSLVRQSSTISSQCTHGPTGPSEGPVPPPPAPKLNPAGLSTGSGNSELSCVTTVSTTSGGASASGGASGCSRASASGGASGCLTRLSSTTSSVVPSGPGLAPSMNPAGASGGSSFLQFKFLKAQTCNSSGSESRSNSERSIDCRPLSKQRNLVLTKLRVVDGVVKITHIHGQSDDLGSSSWTELADPISVYVKSKFDYSDGTQVNSINTKEPFKELDKPESILLNEYAMFYLKSKLVDSIGSFLREITLVMQESSKSNIPGLVQTLSELRLKANHDLELNRSPNLPSDSDYYETVFTEIRRKLELYLFDHKTNTVPKTKFDKNSSADSHDHKFLRRGLEAILKENQTVDAVFTAKWKEIVLGYSRLFVYNDESSDSIDTMSPEDNLDISTSVLNDIFTDEEIILTLGLTSPEEKQQAIEQLVKFHFFEAASLVTPMSMRPKTDVFGKNAIEFAELKCKWELKNSLERIIQKFIQNPKFLEDISEE